MTVSAYRAIPQRLWVKPSIALPTSLSSIADIGAEADGLSDARATIWRAMKRFYRCGMNPGISLAIRHQGDLVFNRALGYADIESRRQLRVDDPVCLFSASKAVTAMLVHGLVEQQYLRLNDRVADYLPEYACNGKQDTTIRDLLAHRAGIPRLPGAKPELLFDRAEGTRQLLMATPETAVGTRQAYHAITGGFVLGELCERVTGKDINQLLDERLRKPLGMRYFHYGIHGADQQKVPRHYLTGVKPALLDRYIEHAVGTDLGSVVDVSNDVRFMESVVPSGNLYATAEETTRFYQLLLDGGQWQGQQIYRPETIAQAIAPVSSPFVIDASLLLPVRFSAGFMLGAQRLSVFGPGTPAAFGHLGFVNIISWADPARQLSVTLLTTGKGVLGPQLASLIRLLNRINRIG